MFSEFAKTRKIEINDRTSFTIFGRIILLCKEHISRFSSNFNCFDCLLCSGSLTRILLKIVTKIRLHVLRISKSQLKGPEVLHGKASNRPYALLVILNFSIHPLIGWLFWIFKLIIFFLLLQKEKKKRRITLNLLFSNFFSRSLQ